MPKHEVSNTKHIKIILMASQIYMRISLIIKLNIANKVIKAPRAV